MLLYTLPRKIVHIKTYDSFLNLKNLSINARQLKLYQILKPRTPCSSSQNRTLMNYFFKKPSINQYKLMDKIPEPYSLIYRNRMDRYLLIAQLVTTVSALGVTLYLLFEEQFFGYLKAMEGASTQNEKIVFITAFVGFCLILQYILYKTPIRIYYWPQQKQYIFIFYGKYPSSFKQIRCRVGDVEKMPEKGLSPWKVSKYSVKDQGFVILMEEYFKRPADLYIMMGIQKDPNVDVTKKD